MLLLRVMIWVNDLTNIILKFSSSSSKDDRRKRVELVLAVFIFMVSVSCFYVSKFHACHSANYDM